MTSFRFRLERILKWRSLELATEESRLKRLIAEEAALEGALARIRSSIQRIPIEIAQLNELRGSDLSCVADYAQHLVHEREKTTALIRSKQQEVAVQTQVHARAKQRVRLLEELQKRKLEAWRHENDLELERLGQESYLARWQRS